MRAEKQAQIAVGRAERAEADRDAERAGAEARLASMDKQKAEQAKEMHTHAGDLARARHDAQAA